MNDMSGYPDTTQNNVFSSSSHSQTNELFSLTDKSLHNNVTEQGGYIGNEFIDQFVAYTSVIICIFGGIGNIISLIVMLRPPFSDMPHCILCASLAFVVHGLGMSFIVIILGKHLPNINGALCKYGVFLSRLCLQLDAWIIIGLSLERVMAIFKPLQAKQVITKAKIKFFLAIIFVFFILFNLESSFRFDLIETNNGESLIKSCEPVYFYGLPRKLLAFKDKISAFLGSVIPVIIITTCNIALLKNAT